MSRMVTNNPLPDEIAPLIIPIENTHKQNIILLDKVISIIFVFKPKFGFLIEYVPIKTENNPKMRYK